MMVVLLGINYLIVPANKLLELHRSSTSNFRIWQSRVGRNAHMISFFLISCVMVLILYYYVIIPL